MSTISLFHGAMFRIFGECLMKFLNKYLKLVMIISIVYDKNGDVVYIHAHRALYHIFISSIFSLTYKPHYMIQGRQDLHMVKKNVML